MSTRIQELMGEDSPYDAARKFSLRGVSVSPQAIYKWLAGGNIDEERLANYLNLIDKIKKDMEQKKAAEDGSPRSKQPDN